MEELTKNTYQNFVNKGNIVIDFWAPWCGPCKMQAPILELISKEFSQVKIGKVNVDEHPGLASEHDVRGIPTLVFIKDGVVVDKHSGVLDKTALSAKVKKHFS